MNTFSIRPATPADFEKAIALLQSVQLPVTDIDTGLSNFLVAETDDAITGVIGLELLGDNALLRSMAVNTAYRNGGQAAALVLQLEALALRSRAHTIYLLTETARDYFLRKGYEVIDRSQAPPSIQSSSEFSHVCPASAVLMGKYL
jgi:amino-acid N-acetyltransferase